ncbi:MAG TPA: hypothetical protein VLQ93_25130 [Myxococcaceae bacterium]|nr:hypothetical protein [Myxococcaceae bacterium]
MSPRSSRLAALLWTAALLGGCTKEESAPVEDRTLARLREEVERVNRGGAPARPPSAEPKDPNARLASLAAGHESDELRELAPPGPNETVHVATVAMKLTGLEALHSLHGTGKVSLTTEDFFVRVKLITQNVGPAPATLSLAEARLVDAQGAEYALARDAQTVAGTRELRRTWETEERESLVLLFEVPPAALAPGLTLVLPGGGGPEARIPLQ